MKTIKVKKLDEKAIIPEYKSLKASGADIFSIENVIILPLNRYAVRTGLAIELPEGYELQVRPRSGLAIKEGITVLNTPGTVDEDYRGEIKIILINLSDTPVEIKEGDRIAQGVAVKKEQLIWENADGELTETERGEGGFGSTGKK